MENAIATGPARTGLFYDTDLGVLYTVGPMRTRASLNVCPVRYPLKWIAGERGKPCINADMASGTEATREPADPWFEILGTNAVSADCAYYVEGGIQLNTHGADLDSTILVPHLDTNQSPWATITWGTDKEPVWECDISTAAAITTSVIWAGLKLTNTPTIATDNDQVYFRYENGVSSGVWVVVSSIGNTDTSTVSTVTVAASTRYHLKVIIDSARRAKCYINGALVYTTTALTDATDLIPYIGVKASGVAAVRTINVHSQMISRVIG
jgi:hypothetical protein